VPIGALRPGCQDGRRGHRRAGADVIRRRACWRVRLQMVAGLFSPQFLPISHAQKEGSAHRGALLSGEVPWLIRPGNSHPEYRAYLRQRADCRRVNPDADLPGHRRFGRSVCANSVSKP
jgi:hypothetical protein